MLQLTRARLAQGLLLKTNPDGITSQRLLFSVVVGALTTSIVCFTFIDPAVAACA
jgi:hypothetical protein